MKKNKGVALIIVIFGIMLLAVLGWTLTSLQSGDFDFNLRHLESERDLFLAEAGIQESIMLLRATDPSFDSDADTLTRTLNYGQYYLTRAINGSAIEVTSTGYIPTMANPRATRVVKIIMVLGGGNLDRVLGCGGIFNWTAAKAGHTVTIDGNMSALYYNGDGDSNYNEVGTDYRPTSPLLPAGSGNRTVENGIKTIPMQWYHDNADCEWPNPGTRDIADTALDTSNGTTLRVATSGFFNNTTGQAVRNIDIPTLPSGAWNDNGWAVILNVTSGGKNVTVDKTIGDTWDNDRIRLVRRYSATVPVPLPAPESGDNDAGAGSGINYIGANITHGMGYPVDVVIDLRNNSWSVTDVKIICEGDIFIKGANKLQMEHSESGGSSSRMHPPLATQNGNITCLDATTANNRIISGVIFSETGTVNWNYLKHPTTGGGSWLRGNMIYGGNIILDGDITLEWLEALVPPEAAQFGQSVTAGSYSWREE